MEKRKNLQIGKPTVIVRGDKSVLRVEIDDDGVRKSLEYCVDSKWGGY